MSEFKTLPASLHGDILEGLLEQTHAERLLATVGGPEETLPSVDTETIPDLGRGLHMVLHPPEADLLPEKQQMASRLVDDIVVYESSKRSRSINIRQDIETMDELIRQHVQGSMLVCDEQSFSLICDLLISESKFANRMFSPLLTSWYKYFVNEFGDIPMEIKLPQKATYQKRKYGIGLKGVKAKIIGDMKGEFADCAEDCELEIDNFHGSIANNAKNVSISAKGIRGKKSVLKNAKGVRVTTNRIWSMDPIELSDGCAIEAKLAQADFVSSELTSGAAVSLEIGRLVGEVKPGKNWTVAVRHEAEFTKNQENRRQRRQNSEKTQKTDTRAQTQTGQELDVEPMDEIQVLMSNTPYQQFVRDVFFGKFYERISE